MEIAVGVNNPAEISKARPDSTVRAASLAETPLAVWPISIGAGPAVSHYGWARARKEALSAFLSGPGIVIIAGDPGTGKTLLLQELARALRNAGAATTLYQAGDLGQSSCIGPNRRAALRVVLIDEADRIDEEDEVAFARLIDDPQAGVVLVRNRIPVDEEVGVFFQSAYGGRPLTLVRLEPLLAGETAAFLKARLSQAGRSDNLFTDAAIVEIELYSCGVPRLVDALAGTAFSIADQQGAFQVEPEHVAEAAALRGLNAFSHPGVTAPCATPAQADEGGRAWTSARSASPDRVPLIPQAEGAARVSKPGSSAGNRRQAPSRASAVKTRAHRATTLALCTVAVGAAAGGWVVMHETGSSSVRTSRQSAAATTTVLPQPTPAPSVVPSVATEAKLSPGAAPVPIPSIAEPPPDLSKVTSTPAPPAPAATAVPPLEPQVLTLSRAMAPVSVVSPAAGAPSSIQWGHRAPATPPSPSAIARGRASFYSAPRSPSGAEPESSGLSSFTARGPTRAGTTFGPPERPDLAPPTPSVERSKGNTEGAWTDSSQPPGDYGPPPVQPQLRQAPQRYVGIYVMGPDGRRTFIASP